MITMRLRNPETGAVVHVDESTARRLTGAGWVDTASSKSTTSSESKPKRRSSSKRSE